MRASPVLLQKHIARGFAAGFGFAGDFVGGAGSAGGFAASFGFVGAFVGVAGFAGAVGGVFPVGIDGVCFDDFAGGGGEDGFAGGGGVFAASFDVIFPLAAVFAFFSGGSVCVAGPLAAGAGAFPLVFAFFSGGSVCVAGPFAAGAGDAGAGDDDEALALATAALATASNGVSDCPCNRCNLPSPIAFLIALNCLSTNSSVEILYEGDDIEMKHNCTTRAVEMKKLERIHDGTHACMHACHTSRSWLLAQAHFTHKATNTPSVPFNAKVIQHN